MMSEHLAGDPKPLLLICMGVSGCGKSTLAAALARRQALHFIEADDYHSDENKALMTSGRALTDEQREPWIQSLLQTLRERAGKGQACVMAYSGLRRDHRQRFRQLDFKVIFLNLQVPRSTLERRLRHRQEHYMPAALLQSQLDALQTTQQESDVYDLAGNIPLRKQLEYCEQLLKEHPHK